MLKFKELKNLAVIAD